MNPIKIPRLKTDRRIVQQSMQELDLVDMLSWIEMALGSKGPKNGQVLNQQKCYGLESTQIREYTKSRCKKYTYRKSNKDALSSLWFMNSNNIKAQISHGFGQLSILVNHNSTFAQLKSSQGGAAVAKVYDTYIYGFD